MKPPAQQQSEPQLDNIQLLLQRRAELQRNKAKYALTEVDAQLIGTHATEVHFEDGQTIVEENNDITNVYRIRSGKVVISRNGFQFNLIGKGWFIGDAMLIYDTPAYTMKTSLKAQGPVVLDQLNLAFVHQIFKVDSGLKAKFMRHLVSKYSVFFMNILSDLDSPTVKALQGMSSANLNTASLLTSAISTVNLGSLMHSDSGSSTPSEDSGSSSGSSTPASPRTSVPSGASASSLSSGPSTSSLSSGPSSSSLSSGPSSSSITAGSPHTLSSDFTKKPPPHHLHLRRGDPRARALEHAAYKSYPLANRGGGIQTLLIKRHKVKVISKTFGFSFKTSIDYSKIQSINKVGENAATIVYQPRKVANVFFKNYYDREEFFGIVNSLIAQPPASPHASASPAPSPSPSPSPSPVPVTAEASRASGPLTVPHNPDLDYDEVPLCGGKEQLCKSQQTLLRLQKGDKVLEEGDLFQRVYTLVRGHLDILQKGKKVCTMEEGDVFGVASLLYMRPCPISLVVGSETADIVYIPAFKLHSMLETDTLQAADLYLHAAQALDRQISRAIGYLPNCKRILREQSSRERSDSSGEAQTDSSRSLHSESSASSLRERSDSAASDSALEMDSAVESAETPEVIKQVA